MKDAIDITNHTINTSSVYQEVIHPDEDYCGYCKHMKNEDAYGFGWCDRLDCEVVCDGAACKLFEEDLS